MRENLNILIFFLAIFLIALGLRFTPSLSFLGIMVLFAIVPAIMLRFQSFFSKKTTILGIFVAGIAANFLLGSALLNVKDPVLGAFLMSLLPITLIIVPDVFATSILLSAGVSRKEIFAFYFWFLISAGLAILFLLPTGRAEPTGFLQNLPKEFQFIPVVVVYTEISLIPSAFCFVFRKLKTFLVFLPMPIVLGYALLFSI